MTQEEIRAHIFSVILARLDANSKMELRSEALEEFLHVSMPAVDDNAASTLSSLIPSVPQSVYEKWIGLFADSLAQTVDGKILAELCNGTKESNASLSLVYLMFMESQRMEKQIAEDLHTLGLQESERDLVGTALGDYLRAKLGKKAESKKEPLQ